jgi:hypothetical protein
MVDNGKLILESIETDPVRISRARAWVPTLVACFMSD